MFFCRALALSAVLVAMQSSQLGAQQSGLAPAPPPPPPAPNTTTIRPGMVNPGTIPGTPNPPNNPSQQPPPGAPGVILTIPIGKGGQPGK
jgi:hypothetical protein